MGVQLSGGVVGVQLSGGSYESPGSEERCYNAPPL